VRCNEDLSDEELYVTKVQDQDTTNEIINNDPEDRICCDEGSFNEYRAEIYVNLRIAEVRR